MRMHGIGFHSLKSVHCDSSIYIFFRGRGEDQAINRCFYMTSAKCYVSFDLGKYYHFQYKLRDLDRLDFILKTSTLVIKKCKSYIMYHIS